MAQASKAVRRLRRAKREANQAYKGLDIALKQRDQARMIAGALEQELKKYTSDPFPEGEDKTEIKPALNKVTMIKLPNEELIQDMINEGSPTHE